MKYGLVLAGGGTRGAYHMGVWKALREMNIDVAAVTGTSIGAVNGALFAQGNYDKAYELWNKITLEKIVSIPEELEDIENLFNIKNAGKLLREIREKNGLDMKPLEDILNEIIDEEKIRSSGIEFGFVTYSLSDMTEQYFFIDDIPQGRLTEYLMASVCLPGFKPRVIDGKKLIDGGVSDNMPVGMLFEKGIRDAVTVDVQGVGVYKSFNTAGMNIISVKNRAPSVGTMDFNPKGIEESISDGYFDTKKAFSRLKGDIYSFDASDYSAAIQKYSINIINGLESAARAFGIDKFRIYTVAELARAVIKEYENFVRYFKADFLPKGDSSGIIAFMVNSLSQGGGDFFKSKMSILGDYYDAANAIIYFRDKTNI